MDSNSEINYWVDMNNRSANYLALEHQSKMSVLVQNEEMNLFVLLKPKVFIDGNMHCVLYGENLQEGIAGFGETLMKAIYDFNKSFHTKIELKLKA